MGSEMCIRDRADSEPIKAVAVTAATVILVRRIVSPRGWKLGDS